MKLHIINIYLFIIIFALLFACNSEQQSDNEIIPESVSETGNTMQKTSSISLNESVHFIKQPCVCFFSMSDEEYENFLLSSNINVKWEFDIMFKRFKRESKSAISSLKKQNISAYYVTKPVIAFISIKKDTIFFKRKDEDYFMGQIFFSGKSNLVVEEGLMKLNQLEEKIKTFFKLNDDFRIKAVYEKVDSSKSEIKDTIQTLLTDTVN
ncbi:MAG: hypothetical protein L3J35_03360 [Bacteroidales bacterium]|nr:hypothetical protein [Bacteroidales bacterium]